MHPSTDKDRLIRRMTELLRSGAIMLDQACPICNSPLFRLRSGEVVCPIHGPVRVVKSEREAIEVTTDAVLDLLEKVVSENLHRIAQELTVGSAVSEDTDQTEKLRAVIYWLDVLERIRRIKSMTKIGEQRRKV